MFLTLPDGCPALTEEGTKEAALDPLMIFACPWHWLGQVKKTLEESVWDNGQARLEMYASVCC